MYKFQNHPRIRLGKYHVLLIHEARQSFVPRLNTLLQRFDFQIGKDKDRPNVKTVSYLCFKYPHIKNFAKLKCIEIT